MADLSNMVGIGKMLISSNPNDVLVAPNLGSCLGIAVYHPASRFGGLIHCLLPLSTADVARAKENPCLYVDTGVVALLNAFVSKGINKKELVVAVAGGANINDDNNMFEIGKRNHTVLRKVLWKNSILIKGEQVGDSFPRTISLNIGSGEITVKCNGQVSTLA